MRSGRAGSVMGKFITFGEIMLRLTSVGHERYLQAKSFSACYAGSEANVAVSLAALGRESYFVTKLPVHEIGQAALNELRRFGVRTEHICRGGERLGVFYCENGASQRPSKVIYDRKHSAIAEAEERDFDWAAIFTGAAWYHFTGITPALSDGCEALCKRALAAARAAGATVSVDLNYRAKLWTSQKAASVMEELVRGCDLIIANEEDAEKVFGIRAGSTDFSGGVPSQEDYRAVAAELRSRFGARRVAITLRESHSASDNGWSALLHDDSGFYASARYRIHVVDRVGGGDAFAAGLIFALSDGWEPQAAVDFAVAASCLKHTIEGDFNLVARSEVEALMGGDAYGRVQR
jgi:2-dehydro-3-deoxygluconokinase